MSDSESWVGESERPATDVLGVERAPLVYALVYFCRRGLRRSGGWLSTLLHRLSCDCGPGTQFGRGVYIMYPQRVSWGAGCYVGEGCILTSETRAGYMRAEDKVRLTRDIVMDFSGGIEIGPNTLLSAGVWLETHDHGLDPRAAPRFMPLRIGANVWIGARAQILPKVGTIGEGAVIAAGAVVTRPVPPFTLVAGVPARLVRTLDGKGR